MSTNGQGLKDALRPMIYMSQLLSLTFFYRKQISQFHLIGFYRIVILTLLLSCLVHEVVSMQYWMTQVTGLHAMLVFLETWSRWLTLIANYLLHISNNTRINNTLATLIDLPISTNQSLNERLFRFQIYHMVLNLILIVCYMVTGHDLLWQNENYKWYTSSMYIFTEFYITFSNIQFVELLFVVREYFKVLNDHLKKCSFIGPEETRTLLFIVTDAYRRHNALDVAKIRKLHLSLCCISQKLNQSYNLQVLLFVILCMIEITYSLRSFMTFIVNYSSSSNINHWDDKPGLEFVLTLFWGGYYMISLLQIVSSCDFTATESKRTSLVVHELINRIQDKDMERQVFSLQLMNHTATFTAGRFFKLDFALIHSIVATITTYLVIIVTFRE